MRRVSRTEALAAVAIIAFGVLGAWWVRARYHECRAAGFSVTFCIGQ